MLATLQNLQIYNFGDTFSTSLKDW